MAVVSKETRPGLAKDTGKGPAEVEVKVEDTGLLMMFNGLRCRAEPQASGDLCRTATVR